MMFRVTSLKQLSSAEFHGEKAKPKVCGHGHINPKQLFSLINVFGIVPDWYKISSIFLLVCSRFRNRQHHGQTVHPKEKQISMNLFKIVCVVTWAQLFLTYINGCMVQLWRLLEGYRERTWHDLAPNYYLCLVAINIQAKGNQPVHTTRFFIFVEII